MRAVLLGVLTVAYPFIVYAGLGRVAPGWLALLPLGLGLLRLASGRRDALTWAALGCAVAVAVPALIANSAMPLKLYPVTVSLVMLAIFGVSLVRPPTIVERIARLREPDLDAAGVRYTRRVTQVWCGFFILNAGISAATALVGSDRVWALYNGLLSYIAMGVLFAGEWCVRRHVRRHHG
ncbi:hypothetical protein ACDA63_12090 [Uliginosibacterium sp. sgz301328]|uniref:COG4648 family protein n=1 Tax=Uliginosibacterium sp. sgz301328 TaxID=3243764 RepID=UPI00359D1B29